MKKRYLLFILILIGISGCKNSSTEYLSAENKLTYTVSPIPIASETLEFTPIEKEIRKVTPSITITKQLTKTPQTANWVIRSMHLDEESTYVLDENLRTIIKIPEIFLMQSLILIPVILLMFPILNIRTLLNQKDFQSITTISPVSQ